MYWKSSECVDLFVNKVINGDASTVLKQMLFYGMQVNWFMTSSPYYGLRIYDGPHVVYGGQADCEHEWLEKIYKMHNGRGDAQKSGKFSTQESIPDVKLSDATCKKCGAWKGQLGHERTPEEFIKHLCDIYDDVYKVLSDDGVFVCNIADSYGKDKSLVGIPEMLVTEMKKRGWIRRNTVIWEKNNPMPDSSRDKLTVNFEYVYIFVKSNTAKFYVNETIGLVQREKPLNTKGVENIDWQYEEVDFELTPYVSKAKLTEKDGKFYRKKNLWYSCDYYCDMIYEPYSEITIKEVMSEYHGNATKDFEGAGAQNGSLTKKRAVKGIAKKIKFGGVKLAGGDNAKYSGNVWVPKFGRKKRAVWHINTKPFKDSHFAVFPKDLVFEAMIMFCPKELCSNCGLPRIQLYKEERINTRPGNSVDENSKSRTDEDPNKGLHSSDLSKYRQKIVREQAGCAQCNCGKEFVPAIGGDMFGGSGTVGVVLNNNGRKYVIIDSSRKYCDMAERRIKNGK